MTRLPALFFGALATIAVAAPAQAHPKLVAASPAANATVASPQHITLRFTEKLLPRFSSADLVMIDMPGMKMNAPMKVAASSMVQGTDGKSLMLMPARPLSAGTYKLTYRVVAGDSHRVTGGYDFRVK